MAGRNRQGRHWGLTAIPLGWSAALLLAGGSNAPAPVAQDPPSPGIPRTWTDDDVATFELPLAEPANSPQHVPEAYYYALPERVIWKSYPIYRPDREPPGYRDQLATLEPKVVLDPATLESAQDWIDAGALVFDAPIALSGAVRPGDVTNPEWYEANHIGVTSDGVLPWARWVVREQGRLEVGNLSCAMCHVRLMPDGSVIAGAQGNFPFERVIAWRIRQGDTPPIVVRSLTRTLSATPWAEGLPRNPREIRRHSRSSRASCFRPTLVSV